MLTTINELDIYLLYYLDIKTVFTISAISKYQYELITNQQFVKDLSILKENTKIIDYALQNNYISILQWFDESVNEINYDILSVGWVVWYGYIEILDWLKKNKCEFNHDDCLIRKAIQYYPNVAQWFKKNTI